jgi:hypothetical protein
MIGRPFQEAERCLTGQRGRPGPGCHRRPGVDPSWARWPVSKQVCLEGETAISNFSRIISGPARFCGICLVRRCARHFQSFGTRCSLRCHRRTDSAGPPSISVDPPPGTARPPMPWTAISERLATLAKVTCRVPGPPLGKASPHCSNGRLPVPLLRLWTKSPSMS